MLYISFTTLHRNKIRQIHIKFIITLCEDKYPELQLRKSSQNNLVERDNLTRINHIDECIANIAFVLQQVCIVELRSQLGFLLYIKALVDHRKILTLKSIGKYRKSYVPRHCSSMAARSIFEVYLWNHLTVLSSKKHCIPPNQRAYDCWRYSWLSQYSGILVHKYYF